MELNIPELRERTKRWLQNVSVPRPVMSRGELLELERPICFNTSGYPDMVLRKSKSAGDYISQANTLAALNDAG